jgi:hypothetical protein
MTYRSRRALQDTDLTLTSLQHVIYSAHELELDVVRGVGMVEIDTLVVAARGHELRNFLRHCDLCVMSILVALQNSVVIEETKIGRYGSHQGS